MNIGQIKTIRNAIGKEKIAVLTDIFRSCKGTPPGVPATQYRLNNQQWSDLVQELAGEKLFLQLSRTAANYQLRVYALPVIVDSRARTLLDLIDALFTKLKQLCPKHVGEMISTSQIVDGIAGDPNDIREALFYLADIGSGIIWSGLSNDFPYADDPRMNISESVLRYQNLGSVLDKFYEQNFLSKQKKAKMWLADQLQPRSARTQDTKHLFSAERAIESAQEDLLGRAGFASAIAEAIRGWPGEDSLVIALTGDWGSGKSSVKNIALEALKKETDYAPQIVEFNPWQWAGQQKLQEAFFSELSIAVGRAAPDHGARKKAARWRFYGEALGVGSTLLSGLSGLLSWLILILAALGMLSAVVDKAWFQTIIFIVMAVTFILTGVAKWGGTLSTKLAKLYEASVGIQKKTLSELKAELKNDLRGLEKLVLVVCDDIDRLDADQTRLLFQLIKANADFPNIVYLLAFQRNIVESHLTAGDVAGREYLEKIVQVVFNIPTIERTRLEHVLFSKLDEILESDEKITKRFEQVRWGNIYYGGLHAYFTTLRDVYRFLSTFAFHVSLLSGKRAFEVNPIDLIALEVFRVFEPAIYTEISRSKQLLTGQRSASHEDQEAARTRMQALILLVAEENRKTVQRILSALFPRVGSAFGGTSYGSDWEEKWFQELRVCHGDVFDRYFLLAIPSKDVSQSDLDELIAVSGDKSKLMSKFEEMRQRELLDVTFDRLDAYKQKIPIENAVAIVSAIFSIGEHLQRDRPGFTVLDAHTHAWRIVYWYLRQEPSPEQRAIILLAAFEQSDGLSVLISLLFLEEQKRSKPTPDAEEFLVPDDKLTLLKERCLAKIKEWAASDDRKLAASSKLSTYLYRWLDWGNSEGVKQWVLDLIKTKDGLLSFLMSFTGMSTSQGIESYVARIKWRINLAEIEKFVPVDSVTSEVAKLDVKTLTDEQKRAVNAFKRAKTRREAGKPDDDFFDRNDED